MFIFEIHIGGLNTISIMLIQIRVTLHFFCIWCFLLLWMAINDSNKSIINTHTGWCGIHNGKRTDSLSSFLHQITYQCHKILKSPNEKKKRNHNPSSKTYLNKDHGKSSQYFTRFVQEKKNSFIDIKWVPVDCLEMSAGRIKL